MESDRDQPSDLTTGKPWSENDIRDLKAAAASGYVLDHIAVYLCRTEQEVRAKAAELRLPVNERGRSGNFARGRAPLARRRQNREPPFPSNPLRGHSDD
jgi:hypothetical protein